MLTGEKIFFIAVDVYVDSGAQTNPRKTANNIYLHFNHAVVKLKRVVGSQRFRREIAVMAWNISDVIDYVNRIIDVKVSSSPVSAIY